MSTSVSSASQKRSNSHSSQSLPKKSSIFTDLYNSYHSKTSTECKSIDSFLAFTVLTGIIQMVYCIITKGYPKNAFIGVFASSVGSFVFAANVRLQWSRKAQLSTVEISKTIIEFIVCSVLLNIFVANYIG